MSGTTEDEIRASPVVIAVLSRVTDSQEAKSYLYSMLSAYISVMVVHAYLSYGHLKVRWPGGESREWWSFCCWQSGEESLNNVVAWGISDSAKIR